MKFRWILLAVMLAWLLVGCRGGSNQPIQVRDAWVRSASAGEGGSQDTAQGMMDHSSGSNSAAYMVIVNESSDPDRLTQAESDVAHSTELHKSENVDGVMTMRPVEVVEIPAGGAAELKPGGLHIMLVGLTQDLKAGEKVRIILEFEQAGKITVEAEVRAP